MEIIMKKILKMWSFFFLIHASPAFSDNLFIANNVLLITDWAQTHDLQINHRNTLHEGNRLLGINPTPKSINLYFISLISANYLIDNNLNGKYLKYYRRSIAGIESSVVINNFYKGLRFNFQF